MIERKAQDIINDNIFQKEQTILNKTTTKF